MPHLSGTALLLASLLIVTSAQSPDPLPRVAPDVVGLSAERLDEATALLRQFVDEGKVAGVVAGVARRGQLAYLEAAGVQSLESRAPMTDRSIFRIYSMAKSVTAVAAMMLYDEGRFRLDDPVSKYLPEFAAVRVASEPGATPRPPSRPVTVEDLLLHTSGLSHRTSELYRTLEVRARTMTLPHFVENITRAPLLEDPGTRFRYSEGTTVVGRLIEVWSGQPFEVFLAERVFTPLGMPDTAFWAAGEQRARLVQAYAPTDDGGLTPIEIESTPFTERPALIEGAVGLLSTVPDYLRFSQMLLNGGALDGVRLLKAETAARMTANGLSKDVLAARGNGMTGWALANVNVVLDETAPNVGEYSWDGTGGTIFWVDPRREMVTVLMAQIVPSNPDRIRQRFKALVDAAVTR
ncbi:MAG: serine hydrolase domain-containing protein [Vicinamibacterales bacterium]|nr:serine hydrolase domain-containing protein [Vicinamibacterales bacterium]